MSNPSSTATRLEKKTRPAIITPNLHHLDPILIDSPERNALPHRSKMHWKRKIFHMCGIGTVGLTLALTSLSWMTAMIIVAIGTVIVVAPDVLRFRFPEFNEKVNRDFSAIMRDYERTGVSGMTWFMGGLLITLAISSPEIAGLATLLLAFGDPWASIIGIRFGKTKLFGTRKTLEGVAGGFTVCFAVSSLYFLLSGLVTGFAILPAAALAALAAVIAEGISIEKLDDNFTIPVLSSVALLGIVPLFA